MPSIHDVIRRKRSPLQKRVSIEAGGNSPFIVFDDADVEKAVEGALFAKFRQTGQTCVCANRIFVQSGVYADFAARLAEKVDKFKVARWQKTVFLLRLTCFMVIRLEMVSMNRRMSLFGV
jgi:acyl-CoA reductase-like NAD-dependent aldehyde dehydrogenase